MLRFCSHLLTFFRAITTDAAIGAASPEQVTKDMIAEVAEQDKLMRQVEDTMRTEHPIQEVPSVNLFLRNTIVESLGSTPHSLWYEVSVCLLRWFPYAALRGSVGVVAILHACST